MSKLRLKKMLKLFTFKLYKEIFKIFKKYDIINKF